MTILYPIVLETEESGAVSAYVPGLPDAIGMNPLTFIAIVGAPGWKVSSLDERDRLDPDRSRRMRA